MNRHTGSPWPNRQTKREQLMRTFRRRRSLTGKRSFGFADSNPDSKIPSTECIDAEPLSPKATRITLSPHPLAHQNSPKLPIKRKKTLPDITISAPSENANTSSGINNEVGVTSTLTDIQKCAVKIPSNEKVSNAIRPKTTNISERDQSIHTSTCSTPDFLGYTSEDTDFGFQDVDLTIDPRTISVFFEKD